MIPLHIFDPETDAPPKRTRKRLPDFLRETELAALFDAARSFWESTQTKGWRVVRQRDYLMVLTAYYAGLRVFELCQLRVEDIDLAGRLLIVRKGKGCKDGAIPMGAKLHGALKEWIGDRRDGILFPDPRGGHVHTKHFRDRIKMLGERAGISRKVRPHTLRHTFCTDLLRRGATIEEVRRLARHSSLSATQVYLHLAPGRLAEVVELI